VIRLRAHSSNGYMIAAMLVDNPDLIDDSNFIKTCESIADLDRQMNTEQMNEAVFQLLDRAQVKPEEIGFNSTWQSNLTIRANLDSYNYYGGEGGLMNQLLPRPKNQTSN